MTSPSKTWRVLLTSPARGAWNMAVDEAILDYVGRGESPPTLRMYSWAPPCLSLGYAQPLADVNIDQLQKYDWDIVRRPTGGRAILHTDELTYAVIGPNSDPILLGGVLESYQRISIALLEALRRIGISAVATEDYRPKKSADKKNPICFEVPSNYEITVDGKKLIGSAQARRKKGVLQHGSLPLHGDLTRIIKVLRYTNQDSREKARESLKNQATTVEAILGFRGDWWIAAQAFHAGFRTSLNLDLKPGRLTPSEGKRALQLYREKFNNQKWTEKY
jgi:lipoate-protein ligase A